MAKMPKGKRHAKTADMRRRRAVQRLLRAVEEAEKARKELFRLVPSGKSEPSSG